MRHLVVVNPKSFAKESAMAAVISGICSYFERSALGDFAVYVSRYPRDAISVVNEHVCSGADTVRVYSVGGDGILYDCLNGIVGLANAELAVIPYGTSNDFVRSFGEGRQSLFRDIAKQACGPVIPTDVIRIGSRYVLNFCCVGVEAASIRKYYEISRRHPFVAKKLGKSLYMAAVPVAVMDKRFVEQNYELVVDGRAFGGTFMGIGIANGSCYGGTRVPFPMAHPADGCLDVMTLMAKVNPRLFLLIDEYTRGRYYKYPDAFRHFRAKEVVISSDLPMQANADGESFYASRIEAAVIPGAVKIVAPDGIAYLRRRPYDV